MKSDDKITHDDLEFLSGGNALVTRRAKAKSVRRAVVVRFLIDRSNPVIMREAASMPEAGFVH